MNPAEAAAAIVIDELLRAGVRDIVLSPGQRSAPLALAAVAAANDGECDLHVRVDERSAGFLALGLAKQSGLAVPVICTSGTAVANLLPAVVEADASDVPLLVVSADRPPELHGVGANQAIDQAGIFGDRVRITTALEAAAWHDDVVRYWRSAVSQTVNAVNAPAAQGPGHLNVALREPLTSGEVDEDAALILAGRPDGRPWTVDARLTSVASLPLDSLLDGLGMQPPEGGLRGVVVVGDLPGSDPFAAEAAALAEHLRWPLLSEPSGNARTSPTALMHGPLLCAAPDFVSHNSPDLVVTVGKVGLHRTVNSLIRGAGVHVAVDARPAQTPTDPLRSADIVTSAVPEAGQIAPAEESWLEGWLSADRTAEAAIEEALAGAGLTGPWVARSVWATAPATGLIFAGSSWPVRFLDLYSAPREDAPWTVGNRGASGIDGVVSTAWGAALVHQRRAEGWELAGGADSAGGPAFALIGDLTALHDINGLLAPELERRPDLTYVVIDNDGGGIFSGLDSSRALALDDFERVFGTPLGRQIDEISVSMGVPAVAVATKGALLEELAKASVPGSGVRVVVAKVGARQEEAALVARITAEVVARVSEGR